VNDDNEQYPQYPPFHVNAYNQVERYPEPPHFHNNEWEGERGHCAWNDHDEVDMVRGGTKTRIRTTNTPTTTIASKGAHL
jgi:hypothetical protein